MLNILESVIQNRGVNDDQSAALSFSQSIHAVKSAMTRIECHILLSYYRNLMIKKTELSQSSRIDAFKYLLASLDVSISKGDFDEILIIVQRIELFKNAHNFADSVLVDSFEERKVCMVELILDDFSRGFPFFTSKSFDTANAQTKMLILSNIAGESFLTEQALNLLVSEYSKGSFDLCSRYRFFKRFASCFEQNFQSIFALKNNTFKGLCLGLVSKINAEVAEITSTSAFPKKLESIQYLLEEAHQISLFFLDTFSENLHQEIFAPYNEVLKNTFLEELCDLKSHINQYINRFKEGNINAEHALSVHVMVRITKLFCRVKNYLSEHELTLRAIDIEAFLAYMIEAVCTGYIDVPSRNHIPVKVSLIGQLDILLTEIGPIFNLLGVESVKTRDILLDRLSQLLFSFQESISKRLDALYISLSKSIKWNEDRKYIDKILSEFSTISETVRMHSVSKVIATRLIKLARVSFLHSFDNFLAVLAPISELMAEHLIFDLEIMVDRIYPGRKDDDDFIEDSSQVEMILKCLLASLGDPLLFFQTFANFFGESNEKTLRRVLKLKGIEVSSEGKLVQKIKGSSSKHDLNQLNRAFIKYLGTAKS